MQIMKQIIVSLILIVSLAGVTHARAPERVQQDVNISVMLIDIDEISSVSESFVANVFLLLDWVDPDLAHEGLDSISRDLEDIWHPRIQILNQQRLVKTFPETVEIEPSGKVIYRQRYWGGFSQPLELRNFPFDSQTLDISIVAVNFGARQVRLIPSQESRIVEGLRIPDWQVNGWEFGNVDLPLGGGTGNLTPAVFSVDVSRHTSFFTLKVIFPLLLIVAMSWMVFWIDPELVGTQVSVGVTAMLTLIAYRFAIGSMVPRLAFLTSLDYFVLASTVLVFLSLLEVVYTSQLSQNGKIEKARALDRKMRWIAPLIYAALVVETLYLRIGIGS